MIFPKPLHELRVAALVNWNCLFPYCFVPTSSGINSLQWRNDFKNLSKALMPLHLSLLHSFCCPTYWTVPPVTLGEETDSSVVNEMMNCFHAKCFSDFHDVSLVGLLLLLGDKQTNTASLTLLPLMHLAKAHFLLVHVNFTGGITEAYHHQSICFGLCEKESHLWWSFGSGFGQLALFCV